MKLKKIYKTLVLLCALFASNNVIAQDIEDFSWILVQDMNDIRLHLYDYIEKDGKFNSDYWFLWDYMDLNWTDGSGRHLVNTIAQIGRDNKPVHHYYSTDFSFYDDNKKWGWNNGGVYNSTVGDVASSIQRYIFAPNNNRTYGYLLTGYGMIKFTAPTIENSKVQFTDYYSLLSLKNSSPWILKTFEEVNELKEAGIGYKTPGPAAACFDATDTYIYLISDIYFVKLSATKPDSVLNLIVDTICANTRTTGPSRPLTQSGNKLAEDLNGRIWYTNHKVNTLPYLDTKTDSVVHLGLADVGIPEHQKWTDHTNSKGEVVKLNYHTFQFSDYLYLSEKYNNAVLWVGNNTPAQAVYFDDNLQTNLQYMINKVLIYENGEWDTLALPNNLLVLEHNGSEVRGFTLNDIDWWTDHEIVFSVTWNKNCSVSGLQVPDYKRVIYNLDTKQWRVFTIPEKLYWTGLTMNPNIPTHFFDRYTSWNNKQYFWDALVGGCDSTGFIVYTPPTDIANTEEGMFQEIGFRKVYPNPSSNGSINAEIFCYADDIRKVELGLYNLFGQKVLDLTDKIMYSATTNTINISFILPGGSVCPSGTYYLTVRKGTEWRTQAIVVGAF